MHEPLQNVDSKVFCSENGHAYSFSFGTMPPFEARSHSIRDLFSRYKDILWEDGRHKYNVASFIGEIDEIFLGERFSTFQQDSLDGLIGTLRERGNSNATINRKMAALSKLLRKACKMGDIHSSFRIP